MMSISPAAKQLLIINVIVFAIASFFDSSIKLALFYPASQFFQPYQFITHIFMHADIMHLAFNMFSLYMFGTMVEMVWKPKRFLLYYFFCAFGAAICQIGFNFWQIHQNQDLLFHFVQHHDIASFEAVFTKNNLMNLSMDSREVVLEFTDKLSKNPSPEVVRDAITFMKQFIELQMDSPMLGASGAIFGLLLAFGMLFPNMELYLMFIPIPIKAKFAIPGMMALELFLGVQNFHWDNVAHFAHLGGALFGLVWIYGSKLFGSNRK